MTLNLHTVATSYFDKLFGGDDKGKVLLVDKHTVPVILMCYTQTELLEHEVVLVETIDNVGSLAVMKNLNCVVYIKPTQELIGYLARELARPHYGPHYRVFFSNCVLKPHLEKLAQADEFEVVDRVCEVFNDYLTVNDNLFSLGRRELSTLDESNHVISVLLALKQCPVIKYQTLLIELRRLALEIVYNINSNSNNNLFDDANPHSDRPPVLLLLDRKHDAITPLLAPWTYQLMLHEYIGIEGNMVKVGDEAFTLSQHQDKFFSELMYLNYGDLTEKFQRYVEQYKLETQATSLDNLRTQLLTELKKLLAKFPEFRKLLGNILKHLALIGELDRQIQVQDMWEIGELQQTLVGDLETQALLRPQMNTVLENPQVLTVNKVKLILLYSVRFPDSHQDLGGFVQRLQDSQMTPEAPTMSQMTLIKRFATMFPHASARLNTASQETGGITNLFTNKKLTFNSFFAPKAQHNDNIYMQYVPQLHRLLAELILPQPAQQTTPQIHDYSTLVPDNLQAKYGTQAAQLAGEVQNIIIYIRGGVTYEEARLVHELSASNSGLNIVIGGDRLLNSDQWLDQMYDMVNSQAHATQPEVDRQAALREIL